MLWEYAIKKGRSKIYTRNGLFKCNSSVWNGYLEPAQLTYGELIIPGRTEQEVILSAHMCHPSLANDNLSGMAHTL